MAKIEMSRSTEAVESLAWRIAEMENLVTVFKNVVSTLQKNTSAGLSNALDLAKINSRMALELRSSTDK